MSFKRYHVIFNACPGFRPSVSWKTYPHNWTFWLRNFEQSGSILQFYLSACWYCISCLSVPIWQSCNNSHYYCGCHLGRRRALLSKDCTSSIVVFYDALPLYFCNLGSNSAFLRWHVSINVQSRLPFFVALFVLPGYCAARNVLWVNSFDPKNRIRIT